MYGLYGVFLVIWGFRGNPNIDFLIFNIIWQFSSLFIGLISDCCFKEGDQFLISVATRLKPN